MVEESAEAIEEALPKAALEEPPETAEEELPEAILEELPKGTESAGPTLGCLKDEWIPEDSNDVATVVTESTRMASRGRLMNAPRERFVRRGGSIESFGPESKDENSSRKRLSDKKRHTRDPPTH